MAKLGIIAGSGRFPILVAEEAKRRGEEIVAMGLKGVTSPDMEKLGPVEYFRLGQIQKPIDFLKKSGVTRVVMAGKVQHASLFGGILPDLRAGKLLMKLEDKRTDTILKAIADEFAKDGIELMSSVDHLKHLLVPAGVQSKRAPDAVENADIKLGWAAAKAVAGFDIGQTVVVRDRAVIAVEAMEGTDATILRAKEIASSQGKKTSLTVVKVAKPKQDMRFDIPVIGLDSLKVFAEAGVSALAVEAGTTLLFDKDEFLQKADAQRLAVVGIAPEASA